MPIPTVTFDIKKNGLGLIAPGAGQIPLEVGIATQGPTDEIVAIGSLDALETTFGDGPLVELAAAMLAAGVPTVYCCRIFSGAFGAVTHETAALAAGAHTGTGTGTVTPSGVINATDTPLVKITTASGAATPGQFAISLDGGTIYGASQPIPASLVYTDPSGLVLTFSAQEGTGVWVLNDTYAITLSAGTGTITPSGAPMGPYALGVRILSGTTFQYSLDGGNTWSAVLEIPASPPSYQVLNQGQNDVTLTFSGGTYVANDTYNSAAVASGGTITGPNGASLSAGALVQEGANGGPPAGAGNIEIAGTPADAYEIVVGIVTSGILGVGVFNYSLDGGNTWSQDITIPAGGTYSIGHNAELTLTFAAMGGSGIGAAFQAGDVYLADTTAPTYTTTDVTNCLSALQSSALTWGFTHLIGRASTASATAALAAVVDTLMSAAAAKYRYGFAIIEAPPDTSAMSIDTTLQTAFASPNYPSLRVCVAAGDVDFVSPVHGDQVQRSAGWAMAIRAAIAPPGQDLAYVDAGALNGVAKQLRDELQTPNLDGYGFVTTRSVPGRQGVYLTSAQVMGAEGTDFQYLVGRRVMDEGCIAAYGVLAGLLNASVRINATNGTILEPDARRIERAVTDALIAACVQPGDASAADATVDRSANILSTGILPVTISIVPLGYSRQISVKIGYQNPAL